MEINSNTQFFIVERNELNNNYMVHSKCNQLIHCFALKRKKDAKELKDTLNKKAYEDFVKHGLKPESLTWRK